MVYQEISSDLYSVVVDIENGIFLRRRFYQRMFFVLCIILSISLKKKKKFAHIHAVYGSSTNFYASATKHLGIGLSVGWSVGWFVGNKFQKSFKNDLCACQLSTYSSRCLELG